MPTSKRTELNTLIYFKWDLEGEYDLQKAFESGEKISRYLLLLPYPLENEDNESLYTLICSSWEVMNEKYEMTMPTLNSIQINN